MSRNQCPGNVCPIVDAAPIHRKFKFFSLNFNRRVETKCDAVFLSNSAYTVRVICISLKYAADTFMAEIVMQNRDGLHFENANLFRFFFRGGVSFSVRKNKWQRNPPEAPSKPLLSHPLWKRKALLAKERVFVKDSEYTHTLKERERQQMETETLSRCANEKFAFNDDGSIPNSTNLF